MPLRDSVRRYHRARPRFLHPKNRNIAAQRTDETKLRMIQHCGLNGYLRWFSLSASSTECNFSLTVSALTFRSRQMRLNAQEYKAKTTTSNTTSTGKLSVNFCNMPSPCCSHEVKSGAETDRLNFAIRNAQRFKRFVHHICPLLATVGEQSPTTFISPKPTMRFRPEPRSTCLFPCNSAC